MLVYLESQIESNSQFTNFNFSINESSRKFHFQMNQIHSFSNTCAMRPALKYDATLWVSGVLVTRCEWNQRQQHQIFETEVKNFIHSYFTKISNYLKHTAK